MPSKKKKNKGKDKIKTRPMHGPPGSSLAVDDKGRMYPIISPGGFQPGAVAGEPLKRGLDGTYRDTCVKCLRPTDTGLVIRGEAEAHLAFLYVLGVTEEIALGTAQLVWRDRGIWDGNPEQVPAGVLTQGYRVCADCAPRGMEVREVHGELMLYPLGGVEEE